MHALSKKTVKTTTSTLVLASGSRYRKELLERLGLPFLVAEPRIDEGSLPGESPADLTLRLAEAKARAVANAHPDSLIVGSDQVAECAGNAIGKPRDRAHALELLREMRDRSISTPRLRCSTRPAAGCKPHWWMSSARSGRSTMRHWSPISSATIRWI